MSNTGPDHPHFWHPDYRSQWFLTFSSLGYITYSKNSTQNSEEGFTHYYRVIIKNSTQEQTNLSKWKRCICQDMELDRAFMPSLDVPSSCISVYSPTQKFLKATIQGLREVSLYRQGWLFHWHWWYYLHLLCLSPSQRATECVTDTPTYQLHGFLPLTASSIMKLSKGQPWALLLT